MSEKGDVVEEVGETDVVSDQASSPAYRYSQDELLEISKNPAAQRRPSVLEKAYDSEEGKWDPEKWVRAKLGIRESPPLTQGELKDRRGGDLDRDLKRRPPSVSDPVERLKENEKDGSFKLSPQRRSFGTGCHVQQFNRQISVPEREREDTRPERDRERGGGERDRDRERERDRGGPPRKIGSGRIPIDRENSRDYSNLRERFDERDRERDRDRDYNWNRDRGPERERDWDRERDREYNDRDWDRERDRDRRYERSDRMRRGDYSDRRDYRGYGSRRRHYEEKEPEWFTSGPTSQNDVIELRGFEKEGENEDTDNNGYREKENSHHHHHHHKSRSTPTEEKASKDSASEDVPEADGVQSQCSSPEDDQHTHPDISKTEAESVSDSHQKSGHPHLPASRTPPATSSSFLDFEQIFKAALPLDEENVTQGSRFSQFFAGQTEGKPGTEAINFDELIPQDLLESHPSPSPTMMGPMGAMQHQQFTNYMHHLQQQQQQQQMMEAKEAGHLPPGFPGHQMPNPAGDNGGNVDSNKAALPPSVTALFNSASLGASNPPISSPGSFSAQDASAQLKAMLFGGMQKKVKTVAELEADMHQDSPKKGGSPVPPSSDQTNPGDMTAFNKLLIMFNAGSEANINSNLSENVPGNHPHGMMPGQNEFNHALMRNKEQQKQLLQQSIQGNQQRVGVPGQLPIQGMHPGQPLHPADKQQLSMQQLQMQLSQQPPPLSAPHLPMSLPQSVNTSASGGKPIQPGHSLTPQAMSTPHLMNKQPPVPRAQSGGPPSSSDPIFNLIQQHPKIVMNPASPATLMGSQQPAGPKTARIPSPLMFSQQPPLHLSAPSPIHPGQLSPHNLSVGATGNSPSGVRSPVLTRVPSPQELSAHAQAVVYGALLKKKLHDQNERSLKKEQERAKPNPPQQQQQHITVVKPQPAAQPVLPPNPQPKGASLNAFTPTSVLRKMHSDKAVEKEKQAQETKQDRETEFMPSMLELSGGVSTPEDHLETRSLDELQGKGGGEATKGPMEDLSDISFLDPVNPNLISVGGQPDGVIRLGQTNILPGGLSQPMSVEEKMKLSMLAEKPGYLSQMLDKSKAAAEAARSGQGRPIVKGPALSDHLSEGPESSPQPLPPAIHSQMPPNFQPPPHPPQLRGPPPQTQSMGGSRPVTGAGPPPGQAPNVDVANMVPPPSYAPVSSAAGSGRAIVGGSSVQQMGGAEFIRMMEAQQRMQQPNGQGNVMMPPIHCLGPPPVGMPVGARIVPGPVQSAALMQQQQFARANAAAINAQRNQLSQLMAMHQRGMAPLHTVIPPGVAVTGPSSAALSPQAGSLSPAALSATLQRVASPQSAGAPKMNGPTPSSNNMNGGGSGIQRWFGPDFLRSQLPSMPPLPTQGSHVMTVDELERN